MAALGGADDGGDYEEMAEFIAAAPQRHQPATGLTHAPVGAGRGRKDIERQKHEPKHKPHSRSRSPRASTKKTELSEVRPRAGRLHQTTRGRAGAGSGAGAARHDRRLCRPAQALLGSLKPGATIGHK